jgi:hypothetical protein
MKTAIYLTLAVIMLIAMGNMAQSATGNDNLKSASESFLWEKDSLPDTSEWYDWMSYTHRDPNYFCNIKYKILPRGGMELVAKVSDSLGHTDIYGLVADKNNQPVVRHGTAIFLIKETGYNGAPRGMILDLVDNNRLVNLPEKRIYRVLANARGSVKGH